MVHDSMKPLQYDRRLRKRRGWVTEEQFESHLADLPDVADKGEVVSPDAPGDEGRSGTAAAAPAEPSFGEPAAPTGFGAPASGLPGADDGGSSDPTLG